MAKNVLEDNERLQDPLFELSSRMIRSLKNNFGFASLYGIENMDFEKIKAKVKEKNFGLEPIMFRNIGTSNIIDLIYVCKKYHIDCSKFVEEYHKEKKSTQTDIAKIEAKVYMKLIDTDEGSENMVTYAELKALRDKIDEMLKKMDSSKI